MKNYREFKRYHPEEWEDDPEWMGCRLAFLWFVRDYYLDMYHGRRLSKEVDDFYVRNDNQVMDLARADYNSIDFRRYDNAYKNESVEDLRKKLDKLERLKNENPGEFILKKNCNLYDYLLDRAARW